MTQTTSPANQLATSEAFGFVPETLPTCPDGSGDLWWDDASYARYQSFDPYTPADDLWVLRGTVREPQFALELVAPNYCDRSPVADQLPPF